MPPFAPGMSRSVTVTVDASDPKNRFMSFASMVIPSNDAFIGNDDPKAYPLFDAEGSFVGQSIRRMGSEVYDAGSEVNDEQPEHTAFFGQMTPDSGEAEDGVIHSHMGFLPKGDGGILDDPMFAEADFTTEGYELFSLEATLPLQILNPRIEDGMLRVEWVGDHAPYQVQTKGSFSEEWADIGNETDGTSASIPLEGDMGFVRVVGVEGADAETAGYKVAFDADWSADTHPTDFPSNPHFSGLIGATHNSQVTLWQPGEIASPGIELMAETGGKSTLEMEIETAMDDGTVGRVLSGGGINPSPGKVSLTFEVRRDFPLVTLVSMIAPSPDWFVGVHDLSLMENGDWVDEMTVNLVPYDAGTDGGGTYDAANADTDPVEPIMRLEGAPLEVDGQVPALGTFTFTRVNN